MKLHISLTEEKSAQLSELIRTYRTRGPIHALELESLIGKLGFSQTCLFGKFSRTQMRYFYKKLHRRRYVSSFSARGLSPMQWWETILSELHPRIPRGPPAYSYLGALRGRVRQDRDLRSHPSQGRLGERGFSFV